MGADASLEAELISCVAETWRRPAIMSEGRFERSLWSQLQMLHERHEKRYSWDPSVAADPPDRHFSFSFTAHALYVVGLHANSSRLARHFRLPALLFNPHEQLNGCARKEAGGGCG